MSCHIGAGLAEGGEGPGCSEQLRGRNAAGHPGLEAGGTGAAGKGDHKHLREVESAYVFESVERLMNDFLAAVRAVQMEDGA